MGKRSSSFVVSDNSSGDERPAKTSKKAKKEVKKGSSSKNGTNVDDEGNAFWDVCAFFCYSCTRNPQVYHPYPLMLYLSMTLTWP